MAKQSNVNLPPATGAESIYELKEFLVNLLGYAVQQSSDGTTYNASGDVITQPGIGANGMENSLAWFLVADPDDSYQWVFQRQSGAGNTDWRVKFSAEAGFGGGTPGVTQVPSATDEQILIGAGTDAAPTFGTLFGTDNSYRWHLVGFDGDTVGVYPFFAYATDNGTGQERTLIMHESLVIGSYPALTGTRAVPTDGEPDPSIVSCSYSPTGVNFSYSDTSGSLAPSTISSSALQGWFALNGSNGQTEAFVGWEAHAFVANQASARRAAPADGTDGVGVNPLDGSDPTFQIVVGRSTQNVTQISIKGVLSNVLWKGVNRHYPDTVTTGGTRGVYVGDIILPFEDGATPLT